MLDGRFLFVDVLPDVLLGTCLLGSSWMAGFSCPGLGDWEPTTWAPPASPITPLTWTLDLLIPMFELVKLISCMQLHRPTFCNLWCVLQGDSDIAGSVLLLSSSQLCPFFNSLAHSLVCCCSQTIRPFAWHPMALSEERRALH